MEEEEGGRKRGQTEGESTEKEARNTPYSRFSFAEIFFCETDFCGENFREFAVTQCTTPTRTVSNCLKIDFRGENKLSRIATETRNSRKFSPAKETRHTVAELSARQKC